MTCSMFMNGHGYDVILPNKHIISYRDIYNKRMHLLVSLNMYCSSKIGSLNVSEMQSLFVNVISQQLMSHIACLSVYVYSIV